MSIEDWRRKIDAVDTALLQLLNLRASLALEVGKMKRKEGVSLRTPVREQEILRRVKKANPGPLDGEAVGRIYELILAESLRAQANDGGSSGGAKSKRSARHGKEGKPKRR